MPTAPRSIREIDFAPRHQPFASPIDWRDQFLYQILLDRFDDNQDHPSYDPANAPRGRDIKNATCFQGGNLKGVTRRLDYIKGMGATGVWITPPFKQRLDDPGSYHGYGIQDFLDIDPRFGAIDDLIELTREAHARGLYVILDIVINHAADVFRYAGPGPHFYRAKGRYDFSEWHRVAGAELRTEDLVVRPQSLSRDDAIWPVEMQNPDCFKRKGSIRDLATRDRGEAVSGDFFSFKDLDLAYPATMDVLVHAYKYWIAIADVDGYRIDTVKNMEPEYVGTFVNAIREYCKRIGKTNFLFFGEIVGDDDLLQRYVGSNARPENTEDIDGYRKYPMLNACLDFPLYADLDEVLKAQKSPTCLLGRYVRLRKFFRDFAESGRYYVTFVDNHDQTHRPWRRFLHKSNDPHLAMLAAGFLLTNIGIPCLYYGTEQCFDGGGNQDIFIRECMFGGSWGPFDTTGVHFFNPGHPVYQFIAAVAKIRAAQPALRYGRQYFRDISGDGQHFGPPLDAGATLAFSRMLDTDEVVVAMNLDSQPHNDWIQVDAKISTPGREMIDLLNTGKSYKIEQLGEFAAVRLPLESRCMAILKVR